MYSIIIIIGVLNSQSQAMWSELDPSLSEQPLQLLLQSRVGSPQAFHHLTGPHKVVLDPLGRPAWQTHTQGQRMVILDAVNLLPHFLQQDFHSFSLLHLSDDYSYWAPNLLSWTLALTRTFKGKITNDSHITYSHINQNQQWMCPTHCSGC